MDEQLYTTYDSNYLHKVAPDVIVGPGEPFPQAHFSRYVDAEVRSRRVIEVQVDEAEIRRRAQLLDEDDEQRMLNMVLAPEKELAQGIRFADLHTVRPPRLVPPTERRVGGIDDRADRKAPLPQVTVEGHPDKSAADPTPIEDRPIETLQVRTREAGKVGQSVLTPLRRLED